MLAALGLITAGCGAESPSAEKPATSEATPTGPDGSSGQPAETGGFIPQREFTIGKTRDDGSSYELTLGFGDPVRAGSVDPSLYGAPNCRTDSERSAIIPARLTVKNTTPGYGIDTDATKSTGVACDTWGDVIVDRATGATGRAGVFAGGDNVNGADLVVTAIRDGRIAANAMLEYLAARAEVAASA